MLTSTFLRRRSSSLQGNTRVECAWFDFKPNSKASKQRNFSRYSLHLAHFHGDDRDWVFVVRTVKFRVTLISRILVSKFGLVKSASGFEHAAIAHVASQNPDVRANIYICQFHCFSSKLTLSLRPLLAFVSRSFFNRRLPK